MSVAYRILERHEWKMFQATSVYKGNSLDERSGYIHASPKSEVIPTLQKYYAGRSDVVILTVNLDHEAIKNHVKWEYVESRGCEFPHIYTELPIEAVIHFENEIHL